MITFAYNGDGLRDSLTVSSNTTTFTWDVAVSIPQVLDDGTLRYVYGLGRIAQVESDETTHYYLTDALGSTMALTDDAGTVENSYEYDVFGALRSSSGSEANLFTFTGEQADASTGLAYLRARYYDPAAGRFVSADPLGKIVGWIGHSFVYTDNHPVNLVDPSGLASESTACPSGNLPARLGPNSLRQASSMPRPHHNCLEIQTLWASVTTACAVITGIFLVACIANTGILGVPACFKAAGLLAGACGIASTAAKIGMDKACSRHHELPWPIQCLDDPQKCI